MSRDALCIGDWCRTTKLGAGRFGEVWLWQHSKSSEKIAIKTCRHPSESTASKLHERWDTEIDHLTSTVRHPNIVRAIKVKPDTLLPELNEVGAMGSRALIMEYGDGGTLRQQMNEHRNVCGMFESEVKQILSALKGAVHYLHSIQIVHRNICPDNVVVQLGPNNQRTYKLCNLGITMPADLRCTELNATASFDYTAPELITSDKYQHSVDYWSLGVIGYEAAAGTKPFAAHLPSGQWVLRVRDKKSSHITIVEQDDGAFVYSDRLMAEHKLSPKFAELLESWLRTALEWHPKQRGTVFEPAKGANDEATAPVQTPIFFQLLDQLQSTKILTLFVLTTHRCLSMAIDTSTTYDDVRAFVESEAQIPKTKCHLIRSNDTISPIDADARPMELFHGNDNDRPMLYVNQIGGVGATSTANLASLDAEPTIAVDIPASVRNVLLNHEQRLKVHTLAKFAADTLHFVQRENQKYQSCLFGWLNYALQLSQAIESSRQDVRQMQGQVYGLKGALDLYEQTLSVSHTLCTLDDETTVKCAEQRSKIAANTQLLVDACEKIVNRYESVNRRSRDASQNELLLKYRETGDFYDIANVVRAYDILRAQINNKKFVDKPHFELFQCAYKCLKRRDTFLRNKAFIELQRSLNFIHVEYVELTKALDKAVAPVERLRAELADANRRIVEHIHDDNYTQPGEKLLLFVSTSTTDLLSSSHDKSPSASSLYRSDQANTGDFRLANSSPNTIKDQFGNSILCFGEGNNTKSLIEDNESLRISISGLMKEIDDEFGSNGNGHAEAASLLEAI